MRLGEEFTFHPSISKPIERKGEGVKLYQVRRDGQWVTQNRVTAEVAEKTRVVLNGWGRKEGADYRMWDEGRAEPKPRARKAKVTEKPTTEAVEAGK